MGTFIAYFFLMFLKHLGYQNYDDDDECNINSKQHTIIFIHRHAGRLACLCDRYCVHVNIHINLYM